MCSTASATRILCARSREALPTPSDPVPDRPSGSLPRRAWVAATGGRTNAVEEPARGRELARVAEALPDKRDAGLDAALDAALGPARRWLLAVAGVA